MLSPKGISFGQQVFKTMNHIQAIIKCIDRQETLCFLELEASGIVLGMLLFDLDASFSAGCHVTVLFKETEVSLVKNFSGETSILNCFSALIKEIRQGSILADIRLECPAGTVTSIITMKALERMQLLENESVTIMIKASQLSLDANPQKDRRRS